MSPGYLTLSLPAVTRVPRLQQRLASCPSASFLWLRPQRASEMLLLSLAFSGPSGFMSLSWLSVGVAQHPLLRVEDQASHSPSQAGPSDKAICITVTHVWKVSALLHAERHAVTGSCHSPGHCDPHVGQSTGLAPVTQQSWALSPALTGHGGPQHAAHESGFLPVALGGT